MGNWKLTKSQEPAALTEPVLREMRNGAPAGLSRRQLIRRSIGVATLLWILEVGAGTIGFLWPNLARGFGGEINLGDIDRLNENMELQGTTLQEGAPAYFPTARTFVQLTDPTRGLQNGTWAVGVGTVTNVTTLWQRCPHLGCTPNWLEGEQKFKCPCHGSGFYKDGVNFEGPAPRPLERYAIRVADDGQLEVDKSQTFNEEKGQWSDSASYVTV